MVKPTLVVMAAGMGSRYGGLKQIDPIGPNGEIIIDYSVYDALKAGFNKVVFVIKEEIEAAFRERMSKTIEKQVETTYVFQKLEDVAAGFQIPAGRKKPWGTGHATLSCRNAVASPFAVINADDFYGPSAYQMLHDHFLGLQDPKRATDYCMVGYVLGNTLTEHGHVARGICSTDPEGYLVEIRERTRIERFGDAVRHTEDGEHWVEISEDSITSMNYWGFTPAVFADLESGFARFLVDRQDDLDKAEFYLSNAIGELIKENKASVRVLSTDERWFGVTYQQDKDRVKQAITNLIGKGMYPETLWGDGG